MNWSLKWGAVAVALACAGCKQKLYTWSLGAPDAPALQKVFPIDGKVVVGLGSFGSTAPVSKLALVSSGQVQTIVATSAPVSALWMSEGMVYFMEGSSPAVKAVAVAGGAPRTLGELPATNCFFTGVLEGKVIANCTKTTYAVPTAGGAVATLYPGSVLFPLLREGQLYFVDPVGGASGAAIRKMPSAGGIPSTVWERPSGAISGMVGLAEGLAVALTGNGSLIAGGDGTISLVGWTGGTPRELTAVKGFGDLTTDGKRAYFTSTPGYLSNKLRASLLSVDGQGNTATHDANLGYTRFLRAGDGLLCWEEDSTDAKEVGLYCLPI